MTNEKSFFVAGEMEEEQDAAATNSLSLVDGLMIVAIADEDLINDGFNLATGPASPAISSIAASSKFLCVYFLNGLYKDLSNLNLISKIGPNLSKYISLKLKVKILVRQLKIF